MTPPADLIRIPATFKAGDGHLITTRATLDAWHGGRVFLLLVPLAHRLAVVVPVDRKTYVHENNVEPLVIHFEGQLITVFIPAWRYTPPWP